MLNILLMVLLIFLLGTLYFLILKPLIPLLYLKVKLGNKAILKFYPLVGINKLFNDSLAQENDIIKQTFDLTKKNPESIVILTNIIHRPLLIVTGPEYIKQMYLNHHQWEKEDPFKITNLNQNGLVFSEGDQWKRQRRFLGGAFTFEKLASRIPMINQVVKTACQEDLKNNLNCFMSNITGEIVINSFFGEIAKGIQFEGKPAQISLVELMSEIALLPYVNPYVLFKQEVFQYNSWTFLPIKKEKELLKRITNLKNLIEQLIDKKILELKENPIENLDNGYFIDIYVTEYLKQLNESQGNKINKNEILEQFMTLFFAGTDTTATTSGTCLYYLAQYPEIQQEILEEVQTIVGEGDIQENHLNKLIKINGLIQEVLRLRNPAFYPIVRKVKQNQNLIDIPLKKDWMIVQSHNSSSYLEKHFTNPEEFSIKRWLNNQNVIKNDNGFIHIPFAAGQRNCIGQHMAIMEIKIIVAQIVRKYQLKLNPNVKQIKFALKFLYCVEPDDCLLYEERIKQ